MKHRVPILLIGIIETNIKITAWISNQIHIKKYDVIFSQCTNLNGGLVKIMSHINTQNTGFNCLHNVILNYLYSSYKVKWLFILTVWRCGSLEHFGKLATAPAIRVAD